MIHKKLAYIFAVVLTFTLSATAQTTEPTPPPLPIFDNNDEILKVESRLVTVPISITNERGEPVLGLQKQDFLVLENKRPQEIVQISDAEKVPLEIAILFDISASTDTLFQFEQEAAAAFLKEVMRPEDRATIFTLGEDAKLIQERSSATQSAIAIKNIQPTKQQTAFYDSVNSVAKYLQENTPQGRRKVVVVISDGEDTNSKGVIRAIWNAERKVTTDQISRKELRELRVQARDRAKLAEQNKVLKNLQDADSVFYSINPAGNSYQLNKMSSFGQSNLEKFAQETGGTAFLPKLLPTNAGNTYEIANNKKYNAETLAQIFRQLANELRAQYLLEYYSDGEFPNGRYVNLDVRLTRPSNNKLRAREGYFVKKD